MTPRSPSALGALCCMMAAAALSHRKVPIEVDVHHAREEIAGHRAVLAEHAARRR